MIRDNDKHGYIRIEYKGTTRKTEATRTRYGILDFGEDVGGLYGTLYLIGGIYNFLFSGQVKSFHLMSKLFKTSSQGSSQNRRVDAKA